MSQTTIPFLLHHAMELKLDLYHTCYQNKNNFSGKVTKTKIKSNDKKMMEDSDYNYIPLRLHNIQL